jgi:hypothetical protein
MQSDINGTEVQAPIKLNLIPESCSTFFKEWKQQTDIMQQYIMFASSC